MISALVERLRNEWKDRKISARLRNLGRVIRDGWPIGLFLVGCLVAWLVAVPFGESLQEKLQWSGWALQIFGLWTVAKGIRDTRKQFGRPSARDWLITWLKRIPKALSKPTDVSGTGTTAEASAVARGPSSRLGVRPDASVEEKLEALEKRLDNLEENVNEVRSEMRKKVSQLKKDLSKERRERAKEASKLKRQLEDLSVGGLTLEAVGVAWLLLGITLSSLPGEVASLLS